MIGILSHRENLVDFIIIISVSVALAYSYYSQVDRLHLEKRIELHNKIINDEASPVYNYRVLVPYVNEELINIATEYLNKEDSFLLVYAFSDFISISFFLVSLYILTGIWFFRKETLIGILFIAGVMPVTFGFQNYAPWSLLEPGLFTLALLCIYKKRYWALSVIVLLGSLNRETAIFIPFVFLLASTNFRKPFEDKKSILIFLCLALIWLIIFFGLRYFRGAAIQINPTSNVFLRVTSGTYMLHALLYWSLFLGGFWIFVLIGYKTTPKFIKKILLISPVYLIIILIWADWLEVRLLMPYYPVLLVMGLSFLFKQRDTLIQSTG